MRNQWEVKVPEENDSLYLGMGICKPQEESDGCACIKSGSGNYEGEIQDILFYKQWEIKWDIL